VLKTLLAHTGRVVTRGRLLRAVWGLEYAAESHYLHVYVSQIRRKIAALDEAGELRHLIASEPGVGYRITDPTANS
jgi:two-component system KDP operon response regulator KdpE